MISRNQRFAFRRVDPDFYIWPSSSIMRCAHISFERSPQSSQTMQPPIAATHSRPVQYSRSHTYRQEAPTPPIPSSPRGQGLVEPYRPRGPPPPKKQYGQVARLGPYPVTDGHLVDVAVLAAPPCELAAYGPHAGGLQALVHARVPHRRYAGMRGGQVVEAVCGSVKVDTSADLIRA